MTAADPNAPICRTGADLAAHTGQVVTAQGRLVLEPFGHVGRPQVDWPALHLLDGRRVLLGSPWVPAQRPQQAQIDSLLGQAVQACGPLHGAPPGSLQNIAIPCLSPVGPLHALHPLP